MYENAFYIVDENASKHTYILTNRQITVYYTELLTINCQGTNHPRSILFFMVFSRIIKIEGTPFIYFYLVVGDFLHCVTVSADSKSLGLG